MPTPPLRRLILDGPRGPKVLIAHRGACASAPEQTAPAFELAIRQGADYLEHDLQISRDGVLICLHDQTLERTTNVARVFPRRARQTRGTDGRVERRWFARDFTLEEILRLDAGSWFSAAFAGTRVMTFDEVLALSAGRAALCSELKDPEVYAGEGVDMLALYRAAIGRQFTPSELAAAGHIVQSFHEPVIRRAADLLDRSVRRIVLIEPDEIGPWLNAARLQETAVFATGIGPGKSTVAAHPGLVGLAHDAGLTVTPWTFRTRTCQPFADVRAEMRYFLDELGVDGVITDEPNLGI